MMSERQEKGLMAYPSGFWRRLLFKAPLFWWRTGLGPVMGRVLMVLTQTGRNSGLPRYTMVEYYRLHGRPYVVSAFGERAQWTKNILADPLVTIQTDEGMESARAVRVTNDAELWQVYHLFMEHDAPLTGWYLDSLNIAHDVNDFVANKERVYIFRFDPVDALTPPPLKADLAWIWLALLNLALMLRRVKRRREKDAG